MFLVFVLGSMEMSIKFKPIQLLEPGCLFGLVHPSYMSETIDIRRWESVKAVTSSFVIGISKSDFLNKFVPQIFTPVLQLNERDLKRVDIFFPFHNKRLNKPGKEEKEEDEEVILNEEEMISKTKKELTVCFRDNWVSAPSHDFNQNIDDNNSGVGLDIGGTQTDRLIHKMAVEEYEVYNEMNEMKDQKKREDIFNLDHTLETSNPIMGIIASMSTRKVYLSNEFLTKQSTPKTHLIIVLGGEVRALKEFSFFSTSSQGRKKKNEMEVGRRLYSGDCLGLDGSGCLSDYEIYSSLELGYHTVSLQATSKVEVLEIPLFQMAHPPLYQTSHPPLVTIEFGAVLKWIMKWNEMRYPELAIDDEKVEDLIVELREWKKEQSTHLSNLVDMPQPKKKIKRTIFEDPISPLHTIPLHHHKPFDKRKQGIVNDDDDCEGKKRTFLEQDRWLERNPPKLDQEEEDEKEDIVSSEKHINPQNQGKKTRRGSFKKVKKKKTRMNISRKKKKKHQRESEVEIPSNQRKKKESKRRRQVDQHDEEEEENGRRFHEKESSSDSKSYSIFQVSSSFPPPSTKSSSQSKNQEDLSHKGFLSLDGPFSTDKILIREEEMQVVDDDLDRVDLSLTFEPPAPSSLPPPSHHLIPSAARSRQRKKQLMEENHQMKRRRRRPTTTPTTTILVPFQTGSNHHHKDHKDHNRPSRPSTDQPTNHQRKRRGGGRGDKLSNQLTTKSHNNKTKTKKNKRNRGSLDNFIM